MLILGKVKLGLQEPCMMRELGGGSQSLEIILRKSTHQKPYSRMYQAETAEFIIQ